MQPREARRLVNLAKARVPVAFIERKTVENLEELVEEARKKLSPEEYKLVKEYAKNPPVIVPPDIRGKRWSYHKAEGLINEYWEKVVEKGRKDPSFRQKVENLIGEKLDDIEFNNFEIHSALSMRTAPENLRSLRVILVPILLKIAVDKGDIGSTGRGEIIKEIADYSLSKVKHLDWRTLEKVLREVLLESK